MRWEGGAREKRSRRGEGSRERGGGRCCHSTLANTTLGALGVRLVAARSFLLFCSRRLCRFSENTALDLVASARLTHTHTYMSTRVGRRRRTASTKFQPAELLLVALATAASARPAAVNATHVARIGIGAVVTHVGLQLPPPSLRSSSLSRPSLTTTTCWRERGAGERRRGGWERRPWAMPNGGADC